MSEMFPPSPDDTVRDEPTHHDQHGDRPDHAPDRGYEVAIAYNGVTKPFKVQANQLVQHLLAQTLEVFGPIPNPHTMALFDANGRELKDGETLHAAGVKPHDHLLLRPSAVKGGRGK